MGFLTTNVTTNAPEEPQIPIADLDPVLSSDEELEELQQPQLQAELRARRPGQVSRRRLLLNRLQDSTSCRACKVGRKWSRRLDNNVFLQNLIKQGDDEPEDVLQREPTVFERLLEDKDAMQVWESFISKPEEEQRAFLTQQIAMREAKDKSAKDRSDQDYSVGKDKPLAGRKSFKKICPLIQEFLNSENLPQGTLLSLEPCLIEFFLAEPKGQYFSDPLGNNDRKVLHGLAQYLDLQSKSLNRKVSYDDHRCTKVTNPKATFTAPSVLLSQFLGIR